MNTLQELTVVDKDKANHTYLLCDWTVLSLGSKTAQKQLLFTPQLSQLISTPPSLDFLPALRTPCEWAHDLFSSPHLPPRHPAFTLIRKQMIGEMRHTTLTNDNSLPMIAVLPAISNGANYRLYRKIYDYSANQQNFLSNSKDQTFPC